MSSHLNLFAQVPVKSSFWLHSLNGKRLWVKVSETQAVLLVGNGKWHTINPGVLVFRLGV